MLLLFNAQERLTYNEVKIQLNLTDEDVVRLLHSLSCAKYKILTKEPPNARSIEPTDVFTFNKQFVDKMRRIKVCFFLTHMLWLNVVIPVRCKEFGRSGDACWLPSSL